MSAPAALMAGRSGWLQTAAVAGVLSLICCFRGSREKKPLPGWLAVLELLWLCVIMAQTGRAAAGIWPEAVQPMLVPVVLMALSILCAAAGTGASARCSSTLWWLLMLLYGLVLFSGVKDIRLSWLRPAGPMPGPDAAGVFLIPALLGFLEPEHTGAAKRGYLWVAVFGAVMGIWTVGTLSPAVAAEAAWPFHEACKSLNLFGAAERFEAFASAAVTIGCFSLLNLILCAAGSMGEDLKQGQGKRSMITVGAISILFLWFMPDLDGNTQLIVSIILWILLPCLTTERRKQKNLKKYEKSA